MKTVGSILSQERIAKGLTLEKVEEATKIRKRFLLSLESDDFTSLPSASYAKGFVRNYAEFLGLDSRTIMAFYRRQAGDVSKDQIVPKGMVEPLNRTVFTLTPGRFLAFLAGTLVVLFLVYLGWQYRAISVPAPLEIVTPSHQMITSEQKLEVIGKTQPDATVLVNGDSVLVQDDGRFYGQITLSPGVNKITIVATSRFGKTTTVVREVGYQN